MPARTDPLRSEDTVLLTLDGRISPENRDSEVALGLLFYSAMNHFTDRDGYNAVSSQPTWTFKVEQPRALYNPPGAYFTTLGPKTPNLSKTIRVPVAKLAYILAFEPPPVPQLLPLPGGRGMRRTIMYSPVDYPVERRYQRAHGSADEVGDRASSEVGPR